MPSHASRPDRRSRRRTVLAIVASILVLIVAGCGAIAVLVATTLNQFETEKAAQVLPSYPGRPEKPRPTAAAESAEPVTILLLGSDTRAKAGPVLTATGSRTDTILLAHLSGDRTHLDLVSIMRDSWVTIPGYGANKINAAYAYGGAPLLVKTLEGMLDYPIDHVAVVNFEGFKALTEALGGVEVNNAIAFTSASNDASQQRYSFKAGRITLKGPNALAYVRERYAFRRGDYQRVENQRAFLIGLMETLTSREVLSSPTRIKRALDAVADHVAFDDGLTISRLTDIASTVATIPRENISAFTMPTLGTGMEGRQSVVYLDLDEVAAFGAALRADSTASYRPPAAR
ncbi:MAG: LCP family protein [Bowdeniella nasicola]|nr:LCP family protein [Bowdeniella nasicola]